MTTTEAEARVASWLLEEEKCVSVAGIAFTGSQNRQQAASVLEKVLREKHDDEKKFTVTKCVVSEENLSATPCTGTLVFAISSARLTVCTAAETSNVRFPFILLSLQSSNW